MDLHDLDDRIDRLSIRQQLEALLKTLTGAKNRLEVSNLLWERVVAAEDLVNAEELKLFDSAADTLICIRSLVGCGQQESDGQ
jgi:hypothetical protein